MWRMESCVHPILLGYFRVRAELGGLHVHRVMGPPQGPITRSIRTCDLYTVLRAITHLISDYSGMPRMIT